VGARVVGYLPEGAWAERVAAPKNALAELPDKVTFSQAATFPVAGLTALHALAKGGSLLGHRVLITGATGGVGDFAVQLARLGGAHVTATARRADQAPALRQLGAHDVVVGAEIAPSPKYNLILDSVGGPGFAGLFEHVAPLGLVILYGSLGGWPDADVVPAMRKSGKSPALRVFSMHTFDDDPAARRGATEALLRMMSSGVLRPAIQERVPLAEAARAQAQLESGRVLGKLVLKP